jgi:hypothetical protein
MKFLWFVGRFQGSIVTGSAPSLGLFLRHAATEKVRQEGHWQGEGGDFGNWQFSIRRYSNERGEVGMLDSWGTLASSKLSSPADSDFSLHAHSESSFSLHSQIPPFTFRFLHRI